MQPDSYTDKTPAGLPNVAADACEYCRRAIWADMEMELYVGRNGLPECPDAPRDQYGNSGMHEPQ